MTTRPVLVMESEPVKPGKSDDKVDAVKAGNDKVHRTHGDPAATGNPLPKR